MAYVGLGPEIFLPELEERPWGRFIDVVPNIKTRLNAGGNDRTIMGASWMSEGALSPQIVDFSCDSADDKDTGNLTLTETSTAAFLSFNLFTCSTLSGALDPLVDYVTRNAQSVVSESLAWAATHALSASHLNLATNSTALSASSDVVEAIGRIESGLAQRISNQRGYIFVPLRRLAEALASTIVLVDNGILVSPAGHYVISDAGHNNDATFYGTGSIGWSTTDPAMLGGPLGQDDITRNTKTWLTEHYGLIAFNPADSVKTSYIYAESL